MVEVVAFAYVIASEFMPVTFVQFVMVAEERRKLLSSIVAQACSWQGLTAR